MTRLKFPEDRTETEVEKQIICNKLIREICMHEIRLATAIAHDDGGLDANADDHFRAKLSTNEIREMIYKFRDGAIIEGSPLPDPVRSPPPHKPRRMRRPPPKARRIAAQRASMNWE